MFTLVSFCQGWVFTLYSVSRVITGRVLKQDVGDNVHYFLYCCKTQEIRDRAAAVPLTSTRWSPCISSVLGFILKGFWGSVTSLALQEVWGLYIYWFLNAGHPNLACLLRGSSVVFFIFIVSSKVYIPTNCYLVDLCYVLCILCCAFTFYSVEVRSR